ncbi:MAG: hypothetical protein SF066_09625 [Thermoanaerobaculia bacterium]|nr:hypothetical protein [Thermoanaerobaculia bacterium]
MPLVARDTPDGPVWVRPAFRPEDYAAPAEAVELFERWQGDPLPTEMILGDRESPFANYVEVARQEREGRVWITLLEASREFALDVETSRTGFGAIVALPPRRAYELACARDRLRSRPVVVEG